MEWVEVDRAQTLNGATCPTAKYTNIQIYKLTNIRIYNYTNIPIYKYTRKLVFNQFWEWGETSCVNFCFAESPLTNFAADNFNNNSKTLQNYQRKQLPVKLSYDTWWSFDLSIEFHFMGHERCCWQWKGGEGIIERGSALKSDQSQSNRMTNWLQEVPSVKLKQ